MAVSINRELTYLIHGSEVRTLFDDMLRLLHGDDVDIDNLNMLVEMMGINAAISMTLKEAADMEPDMSDDITFEVQDGELVYDLKEDEGPMVPVDDDDEIKMATMELGNWTNNIDWEFLGDLMEFCVNLIAKQQKVDVRRLPISGIAFIEPDTLRIIL